MIANPKRRASSTASSSVKSRAASISSAEGEARRNSAKQAEADAKASVLKQQPRLVGWSQPFFAANLTSGPKATTTEDQIKAVEDKMKEVEAAAATATARKDGKLRVLVADDNRTNVEVVTRMLKFEDVYDVTIAKDGQEAYELVKADMERNLRFNLILMDVQMPNLSGIESTRLIRKMGYSAPIVALTAFSEESNVRECMESGMDEFLSKPIRRPALKQVLQKFATIPEEPETPSAASTTAESNPAQDHENGVEAEPEQTQPTTSETGMGPTSTATAPATTTTATIATETGHEAAKENVSMNGGVHRTTNTRGS